MKIDGECHCGYIAYEAEVDPEQTAICHCTDCQTLSGSAFRTVVPAPDHSFRILSGEPAIYVKTGESGAKRPQGFCPRCGSPIYSTAVGDGPKSYFRGCMAARGTRAVSRKAASDRISQHDVRSEGVASARCGTRPIGASLSIERCMTATDRGQNDPDSMDAEARRWARRPGVPSDGLRQQPGAHRAFRRRRC
jgi:hypothetical protein